MTERNKPCPCGSGKKYKSCCGPLDELYIEYRKVEGILQYELEDWALQQYGRNYATKARRDFESLFDDSPTDIPEDALMYLMWLLYNWQPEDHPPLAMTYFAARGGDMPRPWSDLILATCASPYSFFEITGVQRGRGATLQDLLMGREMFVHDLKGSESMVVGSIVMGRVVSIGNIHMFMGMGPIQLPARTKLQVISLRQTLEKNFRKITPQVLHEMCDEILDFYSFLVDDISQPPQFVNFGKEELKFHELVYTHSDPRAVIMALKHLYPRADELERELEDHFKHGFQGLTFPWISTKPGKENGVSLGTLEISPRRLRIHVNSDNRARRIKKIVDESAGKWVRLKSEQVTPVNELLDRARERTVKREPRLDPRHDETLMAHWRDFMDKHWSNWIHDKLPALGGKTPLQAVKTKNGRELVEELLKWMEKTDADHPDMPSQKEYIDRARKQLGL